MTSFSTESLIVRISSFLGIGSLADLVVTPKTIDPNIILVFGMIGLFGTILLLKWCGTSVSGKTIITLPKNSKNIGKRLQGPVLCTA
jgi:hypothetical protein